MSVSFQSDVIDYDEYAKALGQRSLSEDKRIKVRIHPQIFDRTKACYLAWRGLSWTFEFENLKDLVLMRRALMATFDYIGKVGLEVAASTCEQLLKDARER